MKTRILWLFSLFLISACSSTGDSKPSAGIRTSNAPTVEVAPIVLPEKTTDDVPPVASPQPNVQKGEKDTGSKAALISAKNSSESTQPKVHHEKSSSDGYTVAIQADPNEWKQIGNDEGVLTFQKRQDIDGIVAFRGEATIDQPVYRVAAVFDDPSIRKDWIDALADAKVLSQASRLSRVEYNHTSVPWPFHDRDFVYDVKVEMSKNPNTMVLKMKDALDQSQPSPENVVRGKLIYCYYILKEVEPKKTRVVVEMAVDPVGNIPKWLVNLSSKTWPEHTLSGLRKVSERQTLTIPKDLEGYYGGKQ